MEGAHVLPSSSFLLFAHALVKFLRNFRPGSAWDSIRSRPGQVSSKLSTRLRLGFHPLGILPNPAHLFFYVDPTYGEQDQITVHRRWDQLRIAAALSEIRSRNLHGFIYPLSSQIKNKYNQDRGYMKPWRFLLRISERAAAILN